MPSLPSRKPPLPRSTLERRGAAQVRPAADPAAVAVVPRAELSAAFVTAAREAKSDDPRPAVRGLVDRAGVDGIVFQIELSRPADQTVVLIYGTVDGTATAGKDYEPRQGVVTLAPGSKRADVRVPVIEHRRHRDAQFELFLTADPKVAKVVDQRISATISAAD